MTLALAAVVAYGGVLARAYVLAPRVGALTLTLGVVGAVLLVLVLVRGTEELLGSAVLLLGAGYVLSLYAGHHALDQGAPLVAAGLLACTELAAWSLQERPSVTADRGVAAARLRAVAALVLGGLFAAGLVLVVAAAPAGGGLAWTIAGAAAAVLVLALAARLAGGAEDRAS